MKKVKSMLLGASAAMLLSGCASIVSGDNQTISVVAYSGGDRLSGAECEISNDEGKWYVSTPGSVTVSRSGEALSVKCELDGYEPGFATVESSTKAMAFGNLLFGGIVGAAVDAGTGAAFDYPVEIRVVMGKHSEIQRPANPVDGEGDES